PVIVRQSAGTQSLERSTRRLANLPVLAAPGVVEEPAPGSEQLGAGVEQRIAETGAQGHGFFDRGNAAVRIDEAEGANQKAQRVDSNGGEAALRRASGFRLVRARAFDHLTEPVMCVTDALEKLGLEVGLALRGDSRHESQRV